MIRRIIEIDEDKCTGCGICADACHEGAIEIIDGKARLVRDDYCDGLGDCLPECPTGAISFVEREAAAYDESAVAARKAALEPVTSSKPHAHGCPGSAPRTIEPQEDADSVAFAPSRLSNWPVQIKLAPLSAPSFDGADLLVAADCCAYAYGNFHDEFIKGRTTLIGCPKLDAVDYSEKLAQIFSGNDIRSITLTRMEVPCCGGLEYAVKQAIAESGKDIPLEVATVGIGGSLLG